MFRIKICGVTSTSDAVMVAQAGADAVGLNFYRNSKRYVAPELATEIAAALPETVQRVGVFVNASSAEILDVSARVGLDLIQLHGDEPPAFLNELETERIVRAFRCPAGLRLVGEYLDQCTAKPAAVLLDAFDPGSYGGTGQTIDWNRIQADKSLLGNVPIVLAGGLNPHNVAEAIRRVQPWAVDTASGVESAPGQKDPASTAEFIAAARTAFAG